MKSTVTHPEIRRYLAAVDRAAAPLPAGRRRELLADLSEHIDVALAERPGELDLILAELGDPGDIATTAVREAAAYDDPEQRRGSPRTVVALLAASSVTGLLTAAPHSDVLQFPVVVVTALGFAALAMSAWWTTSRKWIAAGWFILPNLFMRVVDQAFGLGHPAEFAMSCIAVVVRAGALVWLWRHRTAPEGPGRIAFRLPRWARFLLWSLLAAFLLFEVSMWIAAFAVTDGLSSVNEGSFTP
ncbi:HAAS signaling domain-containing protein [Streptomyces sp. NPDC060194]|uniref:HAAS signaling domain-containing protein n=1 Tax=Streptomyces sp. NPDC060194 TaxID=3347069 RepID=UPI0036538741